MNHSGSGCFLKLKRLFLKENKIADIGIFPFRLYPGSPLYDKAINDLTRSIKLSHVGLADPEKPVGCFLFTGPTGVGKTELAKQLSNSLKVKLIRFDMSEYMEKFSISRLVGAPPCYVGYEEV